LLDRVDAPDLDRGFAATEVTGPHTLAPVEAAQVGDPRLDHEAPAGPEMARRVGEHLDLGVLVRQREDRVDREDHERERAVDPHRREVTDADTDAIATRFRSHLLEHLG
jgi:hypothetical protein